MESWRNNYVLLLALALSMLGGEVMAQRDAPCRILESVGHSSLDGEFAGEVFMNPAMQSLHYSVSLNTLSVGYDYRKATQPISLEGGDGHHVGFANIDAYLRKNKVILWGNARYSNGTTRNVLFNETSDYEELYPYLMADSVGGNSKQERYHFMGGFSCSLGQWNVAAEGEYTALMEYRTRDPRPKNLMGDFNIKLAASRQLWQRYWLGWALVARKYKQTNLLKLYNEVSVPTIYHLTGMGNDYYRFRGDNTSTYYNGYGVGTMLSLAPEKKMGWLAHLEYGFSRINKIISSLNELPMVTLRHYHQSATIGHKWNIEGKHVLGLKLKENWSLRKGTENIFGTAQDNIYPQIASASLYRHSQVDFALQGMYQRWVNDGYYGVQWEEAYERVEEKYLEPLRRMKSASWTSVLTLDGAKKLGDCLLKATAKGSYDKSNGNLLEVDEADRGALLFTPVKHKYDYLSHDRLGASVMLEATFRYQKRVMPFVRVDWQYEFYMSSQYQNQLVVSTGVRF